MTRSIYSLALTLTVTLASPVVGQQWSQATPTISPSARFGTVMATSPDGDGVILCSGGANPFNPIGDTWEFDGMEWTRLTTTVSPRRLSHAMATDTARARIVLFGGIGLNLDWTNTTFEWDGATWLLREPARSPPPLAFHAMAYDPVRGVTVLYGGKLSALPSATDGTWEWDGTNWTRVTTSRNPGRLREMLMAYSEELGGVVLHGGQGSGTGSPQPDSTWLYDGQNWTELSLLSPGRPVITTKMVTDSDSGDLLFFGGHADFVGQPDETWRFDPARGWQQFRPPTSPSPRGDLTAAWLPGVGMVIFGGALVPAPPNNETWIFGGGGASVATFGTGCVGGAGVPQLLPIEGSVPSLGSSLKMEVSNLSPAVNSVWMVVATTAPSPALDLGPIGLDGCYGFASLGAGSVWVPAAPMGGIASWDLAIPVLPALAGTDLYKQAVSVDPLSPNPTPVSLSNAVVGRIGS